MTRLSILIPWLASDGAHEDTLASVLQYRPHHSEILVVHRGPYDDPYDLRDEVRFLQLSESASRLELVQAGAEEAEGDILHILDGGILATEGWTDQPLDCFEDPDVVAVAPLVCDAQCEHVLTAGVSLSKAGSRRTLGAGASVRSLEVSRLTPLGPTSHAGFFHIESWDAAWGFDPTMSSVADIDLALCLERLGRCELAVESILRRMESVEAENGAFGDGYIRQRLYHRHQRSQSLSPLARLLGNGLEFLGKCWKPEGWLRLTGRLRGIRDRKDQQRFRERLADVQAEVALRRESELERTPPGVRRAA